MIWLGGGVAEIGVPLVAAAHLADDGTRVQPRAMNANGLGPVASAALGLAVPGGVLTVEGRVFVPLLWELPRAYVAPAGTSNDDVDGLAVSVTLGYRLAL